MTLSGKLRQALATGIHRIGEIEIETNAAIDRFKLFHILDLERSKDLSGASLTVFTGASAARDLSSYAEDGSYRFLKGQRNLRRGWVLSLNSVAELRLALDHFYPACVGIWLAQQQGTLEVEHLRTKLERQSGMYQRVRTLSDASLQALVEKTCSPSVPCAKRLLWQLDAQTPLLPSPASRCKGLFNDLEAAGAIPLICREACNHFVAECLASTKAGAVAHGRDG